jgi:CRP/FNR family transcriptional regulator
MNTPGVLDINQLRRSCASCALHELCLPAGIDGEDLKRLDATIRDKRTLDRGEALYRQGEQFHALYVVRSGSLRTFVEDASGNVQVLGFHLPGEIVGVDALANDHHASQADALERSSICELPYDRLNQLLTEMPSLQRQLMRVISREVTEEHQHMVMMGRQPAQERMAIFLHSLSDRYARLHRDGSALNLSMSRYDIASYLGLAVETVSRLFTRMEEAGILAVSRKAVTILQPDLLKEMCSSGRGGTKRDATV